MPTFKAGDIVKVPFPYTDKATRQHRPALVVAAGDLEARHGLIWVCMVTSAANKAWPEDVAVGDLALAGLPVPSVVRPAKIATIDARDAILLGRLDSAAAHGIQQRLRLILGDILAAGH